MILTIAALLAAAQQPPPEPKAEDRIVCRYEARTGTRFKTRVCHTRRELDAISESAQRKAHEMIDRPVIPLYNTPSG
jgi:hypothetical protein